jgi:hypothetical protein
MQRFFQASGAMLLAATVLSIATRAAEVELIPADGSCWKRFAPRSQNAPAGEMRQTDGGYALTLASGGRSYAYGGWTCRIEGIHPGRHYRLQIRAVPQGFADGAALRESLGIQVRWRGNFGE